MQPSCAGGNSRADEDSAGRPDAEPLGLEGLDRPMEIEGCPLPEDRLYDLENDVWWVSEEGGTTARLGVLATLTAFAGPFTSLTFRPVVGWVARGRSVATVESTRFTGAIRLPVDAEILERNPTVAERPRLVNDAPYGEGWIVRVRPARLEDIPKVPRTTGAGGRAARRADPGRSGSAAGRRTRCRAVRDRARVLRGPTKLNEELAQHAVGEASSS